MKQNVSAGDRFPRSVFGLVFCVFYSSGEAKGSWSFIWLIAGFVFIVTALAGFCPLYKLLGINTKSNAADKKEKHHTQTK